MVTYATTQVGSFHTDVEIVQGNTLAATTFAIGDVVFQDTDGTWKPVVAGSTAKGNYGVALDAKAVTSGVEKRRIAVSGHVIVTADGAIKPSARVTVAANARVAAFNEASGLFNSVVGKYVGKPDPDGNERNGGTITDAAQNDKVWIKLTGAGGA